MTQTATPTNVRGETYDHLGYYDASEIAGLVAELARRKASKADWIIPAGHLSVSNDVKIAIPGTDGFRVTPSSDDYELGRTFTNWTEAELYATQIGGRIDYLGKSADLPLTRNAFTQLCETLGIPVSRYADVLAARINDEKADPALRKLLSHNIRVLLDDRRNDRLLVRTLDGKARAILSDRYRILDNEDLFFAAADEFQNLKVSIWNARLSDDRFSLLAVAPHITGEVSTDRTFDPGDGWISRWGGAKGDVHNAAISISNSETGNGGLNVRPAIIRKVCQNFCVWGNSVSTIHLGRRRAEIGCYSIETQQAEGRTIWLKLRDTIRAVFDEKLFSAYLDQLNEATRVEIPDAKIEKAVDNVVAAYEIAPDRKQAILRNLLQSGDRTQFGLTQAITAAAHGADDTGDVEEATELELAGAKVVSLTRKQFADQIVGND